MSGAVAPPGGHFVTDNSFPTVKRKQARDRGTTVYKNPLALWTRTGRETGKQTQFDLWGCKAIVWFI